MTVAVHAEAPEDWDAWLAHSPGRAGFRQSTAWAAVASVLNATRFYFLDLCEGKERLAGAMAGHAPIATSVRNRAARAVLRLVGQGGGTLEIGDGPVLADESSLNALEKLLEAVDSLATRLGVREVRVANAPPAASEEGKPHAIWAHFGYVPHEWRTSLVDLTQSETDLHKSFRQAARKGIRKAKEAGIHVDVFSAASADALESLFRLELNPRDRTKPVYGRMVATLRADGAGAYRFFVARHPDLGIVAVLGSYRFNATATEIASLRGADEAAERLPAQDLLHWEAFRNHRDLGDARFDLAGFNPRPRNAKEEGIARFKRKWGGQERPVWIFTKRRGFSLGWP